MSQLFNMNGPNGSLDMDVADVAWVQPEIPDFGMFDAALQIAAVRMVDFVNASINIHKSHSHA
jgi:hypothetical protein